MYCVFVRYINGLYSLSFRLNVPQRKIVLPTSSVINLPTSVKTASRTLVALVVSSVAMAKSADLESVKLNVVRFFM